MIYDCFLFNDEVELLELRLMETYDFVDWFVLVEAPINWQLREKPLFYEESKERFAPWADKIRHIVADDLPRGPFPVTESAQRAQFERGLDDADILDTVIVSDADEIMSRKALVQLRKKPPAKPVALQQYLYYYWVNCRQRQPWCGPVAYPRGVDRCDGHWVRSQRNMIPSIPDGGYHFSWMGDTTRIQWKLSCHTVREDSGGTIEPPDIEDTAHIEECLSTGKDLFNRDDEYAEKRFVSILPGETHPVTIFDWLQKYPHMKGEAREVDSDAQRKLLL